MTTHENELNEATQNYALFTVEQVDVFAQNIARADRLILLYDAMKEANDKKATILTTDVLRGAVMFMHAALEELVRALIISAYANAPQSEMDKVPLLSSRRGRQAEKFLLGSLVQFRDLTVEELMRRSVESHFQGQTFNNRADLVRAMDIIGAEKRLAQKFLPTLDAMLDRRHQIAHRVDRPKSKDDQWIRASSLSPRHVAKWSKTVKEFGKFLIVSAGFKKHLVHVIKKKR